MLGLTLTHWIKSLQCFNSPLSHGLSHCFSTEYLRLESQEQGFIPKHQLPILQSPYKMTEGQEFILFTHVSSYNEDVTTITYFPASYLPYFFREGTYVSEVKRTFQTVFQSMMSYFLDTKMKLKNNCTKIKTAWNFIFPETHITHHKILYNVHFHFIDMLPCIKWKWKDYF